MRPRSSTSVLAIVLRKRLRGIDGGRVLVRLALFLAERKGIAVPHVRLEPRAVRRERQYDLLAEAVRESLDMERVYREMEAFCNETAAR